MGTRLESSGNALPPPPPPGGVVCSGYLAAHINVLLASVCSVRSPAAQGPGPALETPVSGLTKAPSLIPELGARESPEAHGHPPAKTRTVSGHIGAARTLYRHCYALGADTGWEPRVWEWSSQTKMLWGSLWASLESLNPRDAHMSGGQAHEKSRIRSLRSRGIRGRFGTELAPLM